MPKNNPWNPRPEAKKRVITVSVTAEQDREFEKLKKALGHTTDGGLIKQALALLHETYYAGAEGSADQPVVDENQARAKLRVCPACGAKSGQPCTAPTDTGRREVRWMHLARYYANEVTE